MTEYSTCVGFPKMGHRSHEFAQLGSQVCLITLGLQQVSFYWEQICFHCN